MIEPDMPLHVTLAGQLTVAADGQTLRAARLAGRQGRVILAYLVARHDRPVPSEELAEALWGTMLPATWKPALRGTVSKVRSFLAALGLPAADMLTASSGSYLLTLPRDATVDVELAASQADAAARALAAGDLGRALEAAAAARAIAAEPLLAGMEGAWVEQQRALLRDTLVRSLEVLVDARLAGGHGRLAIQPARELVGLEPFRESAHLRLLRALAAAGDRAEALRAYEGFRRLLAEELGVEPSAELKAAYLELLGAKPAAPPAAPAATRDFVGRARELTRLRVAWADARAGRQRVVLITGEAGIGKTRLAAELVEEVAREGATVMAGNCDERAEVAYLPLRRALGQFLTACPPDRLRELVGPLGGELARFWPELARRLPALPPPTRGSPETERHLLFEAVTRLLHAAAAASPVLLVLDDLHWADEPSLLLLRHLARAPDSAALLLIAIYRDDEEPRADLAATTADLRVTPDAGRLALAGLEVGEVAAMAEFAAGRPSTTGREELARVLRERTGGNPFFLGELLRHLAETGALSRDDAARLAAGPVVDDVPEPVRRVVTRRLDRLGGMVARVLDAAAVVGHEADLAVLARVVDLGHGNLLAALDQAVRAGLLDERPGMPWRYGFHHAIVHNVVYEGLPAGARALLHHQVGQAIEGLGGGASRLRDMADHFALGSAPGDATKAVDYARRAGDQALAQLLYEEAAHRYQQALAALARAGPDDEALRCDLLLALADALTRVGRATRASHAYLRAVDAARAAGSAERLARAVLGMGGPTAFWSLDPSGALTLLREALAAVGPEDSPVRALLLGRLEGWQAVPTEVAGPPLSPKAASPGAAVAMARRLGDARTLAAVLADQAFALGGMVLDRPGGPGGMVATTAELYRLAGELDDGLAYRASMAWGEALLAAGDLASLDRLCEREERLARDRRMPHYRWLPLAHRAARAVMRGDFADGERLAGEALAVGQGPLGSAAAVASNAQLVMLRWLEGRLVDMEATLERLTERNPLGRGWSKLLLLADAGQGRKAEARRSLDAAAAGRFVDWRACTDVVALTAACALLDDAAFAAALYRRLLSWSGWHLGAVTLYLGAADLHLGILATVARRFEEAERHLRAAHASHQRLRARPWNALTQRARADMLRRRGRPGDHDLARRMDDRAGATATALGMRLPAAGWSWDRPAG
jgi:DNA-binding SARP family transcriptional activator/tetratricopeptide (TPR) repeat protein